MLHILAAVVGVVVIVFILWDTFETIVLTRLYYVGTWAPVAGTF
jgi:hypothetical protein